MKIFSAYGKIRSWKYMLHFSGVNRGEPRDYCFVEFTSREVDIANYLLHQNCLCSARKLKKLRVH